MVDTAVRQVSIGTPMTRTPLLRIKPIVNPGARAAGVSQLTTSGTVSPPWSTPARAGIARAEPWICRVPIHGQATGGLDDPSDSADPRAMQRKPIWLIALSIICGWRAAGR